MKTWHYVNLYTMSFGLSKESKSYLCREKNVREKSFSLYKSHFPRQEFLVSPEYTNIACQRIIELYKKIFKKMSYVFNIYYCLIT